MKERVAKQEDLSKEELLTRLGEQSVALKKLERELEIEASLEMVRSRALAMHNSSELTDTSSILFHELKKLGIETLRSGVGIINYEADTAELWLTAETSGKTETKILGTISGTAHPLLRTWIQSVREGKTFHHFILEGEEVRRYYEAVGKTLFLPLQKKYNSIECYYGFFFREGTLNVISPKPLTGEECNIMVRFARVFGLIYRRFLDLQKAEANAREAVRAREQVENALVDLKQAQAQLIQSEKMASLGELTAGIAHEIQNPLNFVNNFSEVSNELLDEMITELVNNNKEDAITIADDVKKNLQKILHHGQRADGIVKGMLQHSRTSNVVKEPTNINQLADEYLKLAYHGIRAKEKSFNVTLNTNYDESIGNINVIPQDIGRAILNLITNAFYAVAEKKKTSSSVASAKEDEYEPIVVLSTKKINGKVEIRVRDNGNGILQKVVDKIFQPFFTTKPTGQGTGLGLSLSYDIIKAHGGDIKVETEEGIYAEFIILLPLNKS